jgi:hypothetical protein
MGVFGAFSLEREPAPLDAMWMPQAHRWETTTYRR